MLKSYLTMVSDKKIPEITISIIAVCLSAAALLFWLIAIQRIPLPIIIQNLSNNFYSANNENTFVFRKINNINPYLYIYLLLGLSIVGSIIFRNLWKLTGRAAGSSGYIIFLTALVIFSFVIGIQTINQIKRSYSEIKVFTKKTLSEKNSLIFGLPYNFAMFCRELHHGKHRGTFITDLDLNSALGLMLHHRICYHLYPIDISLSTDQPIDCYIIFQKKNPSTTLLKDFETVYTFNQFNLLAIKKELD